MEPTGVLVRAIAGLGGTARIGDLTSAGYSPRHVQAAISAGSVIRLRRGLVGIRAGNDDVRHALLASGLITCVSAARELGLWTIKDPKQLHLWTNHSRIPTGVARHRGELFAPRRPGAYVGVLDAVLHSLCCLPRLEALVIAESAVNLGLVTQRQLLTHLPGRRNGIRRAIVESIVEGAESPIEVVARDLFRLAGLRVEIQVSFTDVGRVDVVVEKKLIVELDGFDFHWNRAAFIKDRRRNNAAVLLGLPTLRYVYEDVVFHPDAVLSQVLTMLRRMRG